MTLKYPKNNMNYPRISIVTPSFNQGQYIEETILSIVNQNYPNLEFIIIDGGSTDNTVSIIKKYEKFITYWVSEKDLGQANAINKGLKYATGEIFNWINSDDILNEGALFKIALAYDINSDLIAGKVLNFCNSRTLSVVTNSNLNFSDFVSGKSNWHQPGIWINLKKHPNIIIKEKFNFCFDFYLISKLLLSPQLSIVDIDYVLVKFRIHDNSKTGSGNISYFNDMLEILNDFIADKTLEVYQHQIRNYIQIIRKNLNCNYAVRSILLSQHSRMKKIFIMIFHYLKNIKYCSNRFFFGALKNIFINKYNLQ